jgi:hypothetical protein
MLAAEMRSVSAFGSRVSLPSAKALKCEVKEAEEWQTSLRC